MEVLIYESPEAAALQAADIVQHTLHEVDAPVLGLATGSSPLLTYRELIRRYRLGELSFAGATAFLLDEYVGLSDGHPEAYRTFIERELVDHIDLSVTSVHAPPVADDALRNGLEQYDEAIRLAGGIDVQLLGIGSDGHIGFNEPGSSLRSRTRMKTLTGATRSDNARFFGGDVTAVPHHVVTQGIGTILEARRLVLIATGTAKAQPVAAAVEGPLSAMVPASALQLHPNATVVLDDRAAAELRQAEYYREVQSRKPAWQQP
ncbi:MAG: glucosamine-6-phosphate deaminase [Actinomycetota bacterium]